MFQSENANQLIAGIDHQLSRIIDTAKAYTALPDSPQNSQTKVRLYAEYEDLKGNLWLMYAGQGGINGVSDKLEARNEALQQDLNQYLIDYIDPIQRTAQAPAFIDYLIR